MTFDDELLASHAFSRLTTDQHRALLSRLIYVLEICDKLEVLGPGSALSREIADIELDVWVNVGAPESGVEREISSWLIQTSWSAECDRQSLTDYLAPPLVNQLTVKPLHCTQETLVSWLKDQASHLRAAALGALGATEICVFVAHMTALSILMLDVLSSVGRVRVLSPEN